MGEKKTILLVSDCPVVLVGLRDLLCRIEGLEIAGETSKGPMALDLVEKLHPHLVILDLKPGGAEICRGLKFSAGEPLVLIYTHENAEREIWTYLLAGADSFVHQGERPATLREAVIETLGGERIWLTGAPTPAHFEEALIQLTEREKEVLTLILRGCSQQEAAALLYVTRDCIKFHTRNIRTKLGIKSLRDLF